MSRTSPPPSPHKECALSTPALMSTPSTAATSTGTDVSSTLQSRPVTPLPATSPTASPKVTGQPKLPVIVATPAYATAESLERYVAAAADSAHSVFAAPSAATIAVGLDGQPVREWINTLLMAAVIAKDKQHAGGSSDSALASAPAVTATAQLVPDSPPEASASSSTEPITVSTAVYATADMAAENSHHTLPGNRNVNTTVESAVTADASIQPHVSSSIVSTHSGPVNHAHATSAEVTDSKTSVNSNSSSDALLQHEAGLEKKPPVNASKRARRDNDIDDSIDNDDDNDDGFESETEGETKRYRRRHCKVPDCPKFARFNSVCSGHGGRRLCAHAGCVRVAQFGHKCSTHGGIKHCRVDGCERAVQSRGCCKTHGGGVRCQTPGCEKGAISKGHCRTHGGGSRCAATGCQKWSQRHGFCVKHSKEEDERSGNSENAGVLGDDGADDAIDCGSA